MEPGAYEGHPEAPTSVRIHGYFVAASSWLSNDNMQGTWSGLLLIWPSQTPDCCGEYIVNIGVRQHKTNMIIVVTGERHGVTDAEFLGKEI